MFLFRHPKHPNNMKHAVDINRIPQAPGAAKLCEAWRAWRGALEASRVTSASLRSGADRSHPPSEEDLGALVQSSRLVICPFDAPWRHASPVRASLVRSCGILGW